MAEQVYSVSQFIEVVNQTLEYAYPEAVVEGEVAGFEIKQDRWVHFTLKDKSSSLRCFMTVYGLKTPIEDGMMLRATGRPKLTQWGSFSFNVRDYQLAGEGTLKHAYELLKAKLSKEGLFAEERKRQLPAYPGTVGLVTSTESEAYKDFVKIINDRWTGLKVQVARVQVQGVGAPEQIVAALEYFNQMAKPPDVVVVVRGGGSLEDLQAFNTETVARALAASRSPLVVGVGHEGDVTLADLAADVRAATPSDAAKRVVPDRASEQSKLLALYRQLNSAQQFSVERSGDVLYRHLLHLFRQIQEPQQRLAHNISALNQNFVHISRKLVDSRQNVDGLVSKLYRAEKNQLGMASRNFAGLARSLRAIDPSLQLKRGYSIARKNGHIIKTASQVELGDRLMLQLAKDSLGTEVKEIKRG